MFSSKDIEKKSRTETTILTKITEAINHKNESNKLRFSVKHVDKVKEINKTHENLQFKSSNIRDNEIYEHVTGKENDIDERALVFIEQRYKVPFHHTVQQKHMPKNFNSQNHYRTFLSNANTNEDLRQIFLHKFPENKRQPIRSHKDIYMGDKANGYREDVYLKEYNSKNILVNSKDDDRTYLRNMKKKVNIINSNMAHRHNDNYLKDELVNMDHHGGDVSGNHDRLLREQLITFKDQYRRVQDHENREKQLLNDINTINTDLDTITAEHREYLGHIKVPLVKQVRGNSNKDHPQIRKDSKLENHLPQEGLMKEFKTVPPPSVTQFYASPTNFATKTLPKSTSNFESIFHENEQSHYSQRQQLQSVVQPAYLSNPPDIDFHDSRILSKIDEMNSLSASIEKDKRSSSIATFSKTVEESNKTTRGAEIKIPCMYPDCLRQWRPS